MHDCKDCEDSCSLGMVSAVYVRPHDCHYAWCQRLSVLPFAVKLITHEHMHMTSVFPLFLTPSSHTHAHPQHTNTHTHSHKAADVIILCNLGEWLERLSWSPGSILQKPRHLITKWGHWLGLLRENQMQKRPHNTERVERMRNTINKKLTHTFEFGLRYIVMNRFTDRQS